MVEAVQLIVIAASKEARLVAKPKSEVFCIALNPLSRNVAAASQCVAKVP